MDPRFTLKKNSDFRRLYHKGKSAVNGYMVLYCRKNNLGRSRIGYTVSAKLGGAVVRNRVRRRYREIYRLNSSQLQPGYDLILVARTRSVGAKYSKMNNAFLKACHELKLCRVEAQPEE